MRFVILHHHILKNAGSTIEEILDHSFGERFARLDSPERDHVIGNDELMEFVSGHPEATAISSHQIRYPMPAVKGVLFFDICFLRDPLERVRSMYDYFRKRPAAGDPVSELANTTALGEFVAGMVERFPLQIRDVQVNLLAARGDSDEPDAGHLRLATERILRASFPGVVDLFEESVRAGEYFLQQVFPELDCARPAANVSRELEGGPVAAPVDLKAACRPSVYEALVKLNRLDLELLARAREEVKRRAALVPEWARERQPVTRFAPQGFLQRLGAGLALRREGLFDPAFYLKKYPDVAAAGANPFLHYVRYGAAEGRKPHPLFQPGHLRNPHRLFDVDAYLEAYPEAGDKPLAHYVQGRTFPKGALVIDDVDLPVKLLKKPVKLVGAQANVAMVWPEAEGGMGFIAPPEQRRFFGSLNYDQLEKQIQYGQESEPCKKPL